MIEFKRLGKNIEEIKTIRSNIKERSLMFPALFIITPAAASKSPEVFKPSDIPMSEKRSARVLKSIASSHEIDGGLKNDDMRAAINAIVNTASRFINLNILPIAIIYTSFF